MEEDRKARTDLLGQAISFAATTGNPLDLSILDNLVNNPFKRLASIEFALQPYLQEIKVFEEYTGATGLGNLYRSLVDQLLSNLTIEDPGFLEFSLRARKLFQDFLLNNKVLCVELIWDLADWQMDATLEGIWKAIPQRTGTPNIKEILPAITSTFEALRMIGLPLALAVKLPHVRSAGHIADMHIAFRNSSTDVANVLKSAFPNMFPDINVWRTIRNSEGHSCTTFDPNTNIFTFRSSHDSKPLEIHGWEVLQHVWRVVLCIMSISTVTRSYFFNGGIPILIHNYRNEPDQLSELANKFSRAMSKQRYPKKDESSSLPTDFISILVNCIEGGNGN